MNCRTPLFIFFLSAHLKPENTLTSPPFSPKKSTTNHHLFCHHRRRRRPPLR
ncbi:hypothetical protein Hdeb2414_s0246g00846511 [Helianthus debilis subsp. tardiflorus]